jgi:hypothetical protein
MSLVGLSLCVALDVYLIAFFDKYISKMLRRDLRNCGSYEGRAVDFFIDDATQGSTLVYVWKC